MNKYARKTLEVLGFLLLTIVCMGFMLALSAL